MKLLRIRARRAAGGQRPGQEVRTGLERMGTSAHRAPPLAGSAIGETSASTAQPPSRRSLRDARKPKRGKSLGYARSRYRKGPKSTVYPTYAHLPEGRKGKSMSWFISDLRFSLTADRITSHERCFPMAKVRKSPVHGRKRGFSQQGINRVTPLPPGKRGSDIDAAEVRHPT